jgi:hypothetical protein
MMTELQQSQIPPAETITRTPRQDSARTVISTVGALILVGALTGAIASFVILGLDAFLSQLGNPTSQRFSQLLFSMLRRMSSVLAVWFQAPVDGAIMGAVTGGVVSIAYLLGIWLDRSATLFSDRKWLAALGLAAAGAIGAVLGSRGVLADLRLWAAVAGALYGFVAGYLIARAHSESRR